MIYSKCYLNQHFGGPYFESTDMLRIYMIIDFVFNPYLSKNPH